MLTDYDIQESLVGYDDRYRIIQFADTWIKKTL